jgi:transposase-like protein
LIDKRCDEMSNGALAVCVDALEARLDALARAVGRIAEDLEALREKPTPPKPKCPWCGGETVFDNNGLLSTRYRCTNTACLKVFWV